MSNDETQSDEPKMTVSNHEFNEEGTWEYTRQGFTRIHSPSEHTVDGKHYDVELNFGLMRFPNSNNSENFKVASTIIFFDLEAGGDVEDPYLKSMFEAFDQRSAGSDRPKFDLAGLIDSSDTSKVWFY